MNPLDKHVNIICDAPEYLTEEHSARLLPILTKNIDVSTDAKSLLGQIDGLMKLQAKILKSAQNSHDADPKELRQAMSSGKDLVNMLIKFKELLDQERKDTVLEACVIETFNELDNDPVRDKFLKKLRKRLKAAEAE